MIRLPRSPLPRDGGRRPQVSTLRTAEGVAADLQRNEVSMDRSPRGPLPVPANFLPDPPHAVSVPRSPEDQVKIPDFWARSTRPRFVDFLCASGLSAPVGGFPPPAGVEMSTIEGKVVVTGASSGPGEATARLLSEQGAVVVLERRLDRRPGTRSAGRDGQQCD